MSGELRELLADDVLVEDLGTHAVKGWPDLIPVYGLIALRADERLIES